MVILPRKYFSVTFTVILILVGSAFSDVSVDPFIWGVATAAYQIEGAVSDGGRGSTIWDTFAALPGKTNKGETGEIADGSYYRIKEDVQLIKNMGLTSYRFSIAWSRIMPTGEIPINQAGIDHYNNLLDELEKHGIEPLVTLYHWDLPSALEQKYDGWLSPSIEKDFAAYADVCFAAFGDRVKMWTTINEPWTFCLMGYVTGAFAPGRCSNRDKCTLGDSSTEGYIAAHNVLNAHAAAVAVYRTKYQAIQGGQIGIVLNQDWAEPLSDDPLDVVAAARKNEFTMGWFGDPLAFGRYPDSMVQLVGDRLPVFTPLQRERLIGSSDYFAMNHYSTKFYYDPLRPLKEGEIRVGPDARRSLFDATGGTGWAADQLNSESKHDMQGQLIGPEAASAWLHVVPWGFHRTIMWNHHRYTVNGKPPVMYITENGCDVPLENEMPIALALDDSFRVEYYRSYLLEMERAMDDGADVRGYYAWSLLDNYEWIDGFTNRFGLVYIDYKNASLPRYPKKSSRWYAEYAQTHLYYNTKGHVTWDNQPDQIMGGYYYDDGAESAAVISIVTGNSSSAQKNSDHDGNADKEGSKGGKTKGHKKGHKKGGKDGGKGKGKSKSKGKVIPDDDDYTLDPSSSVGRAQMGPMRSQRMRMEAVLSSGGWVDYLHAAMGSYHGAAVFGPQGAVAW